MHEPLGTIPLEMKMDAIETRGADWGGITVRHLDLPAGVDFTPLLAGLPGDVCACPHWGYVLRGSIHVRYADGTEEVTSEGEAYFWPGGHTGWSGSEGVTFLEYSPTEEIAPVLAHLAAKMSA
jgi:hypothetical protein